jgi:hypothetical protein
VVLERWFEEDVLTGDDYIYEDLAIRVLIFMQERTAR